jgi:hypothetical protein
VIGARSNTNVIARAIANAAKIEGVRLRDWYSAEVSNVPV